MKNCSYLLNVEDGSCRQDWNSRNESVFTAARNLEGYFKPTKSRKKLRHRIRQAMKVFIQDRDGFFTENLNNL